MDQNLGVGVCSGFPCNRSEKSVDARTMEHRKRMDFQVDTARDGLKVCEIALDRLNEIAPIS